jgi:hypothetical protein
MARTALTVSTISRSGVDSADTLEAANADGEMFYNGGDVFLEVLNTNASTCTVTVVTPRTIDGLAVADVTVEVDENERMFIGPFPPSTFNQTSTNAGMVYVNFDTVTDVTVAAWRMG